MNSTAGCKRAAGQQQQRPGPPFVASSPPKGAAGPGHAPAAARAAPRCGRMPWRRWALLQQRQRQREAAGRAAGGRGRPARCARCDRGALYHALYLRRATSATAWPTVQGAPSVVLTACAKQLCASLSATGSQAVAGEARRPLDGEHSAHAALECAAAADAPDARSDVHSALASTARWVAFCTWLPAPQSVLVQRSTSYDCPSACGDARCTPAGPRTAQPPPLHVIHADPIPSPAMLLLKPPGRSVHWRGGRAGLWTPVPCMAGRRVRRQGGATLHVADGT